MANYTGEKAKYGATVGSILVHSTPLLGFTTDPNSDTFKSNIPGGYLRCDGKTYNAKDFLALSRVLGTGDESRFLKEGQTIRAEDATTGDLGQFVLPDLGSKVIIGGRGTGSYNNFLVDLEGSNVVTNRVGPQIEIISNQGDTIEAFYTGNLLVAGEDDIAMTGNARYTVDRSTSETTLSIENFQGHAHNSNQRYTNYVTRHEVSPSGGKDSGTRPSNPDMGQRLDVTNQWNGTSVHKHNITRPVSYGQTFTYGYDSFNVDMSQVSAYVDADVENDTKLDQLVTPFILVEYIIKF